MTETTITSNTITPGLNISTTNRTGTTTTICVVVSIQLITEVNNFGPTVLLAIVVFFLHQKMEKGLLIQLF